MASRESTTRPRTRNLAIVPYRATFIAAAAYNIGFGLWAVLVPSGFFDVFELTQPRYPAIWQTLGMVLGLYGLLYLYAARHPNRADPIIAVGLLGKILGPIGWVLTVHNGELPPRTFLLILFDDLVWLLPFALFLLRIGRDRPRQRVDS